MNVWYEEDDLDLAIGDRTVEQCWVLTGRARPWYWRARFDRYSVGQPASVAFDHDYVMRFEDAGTPIIGWVHTHPHWPAAPSQTDLATMRAWVTCLGRPLLCCIIGTDGLRAHWFKDDESDPIEVRAFRPGGFNIWGRTPRPVGDRMRAIHKACGAKKA